MKSDRVELIDNKDIISTYGEFETVSFEAPYEENKEFIKWLNENLKPLRFEKYIRHNAKKRLYEQHDQYAIRERLIKTLKDKFPHQKFLTEVMKNRIIIGVANFDPTLCVPDIPKELGFQNYPIQKDHGCYNDDTVGYFIIDISKIYEE